MTTRVGRIGGEALFVSSSIPPPPSSIPPPSSLNPPPASSAPRPVPTVTNGAPAWVTIAATNIITNFNTLCASLPFCEKHKELTLSAPPTHIPNLPTLSSTFKTYISTGGLLPQQTPGNTDDTPISPSNNGLSTGAKAGIGVGAVLGVLLIALVAFLLGFKARHRAANSVSASKSNPSEADAGILEHKAELDGSGRQAAELEGTGITRWWGKRFRGSVHVKALNDSAPLELPAEDVKGLHVVSQKKVRNEGLDEYVQS